MDDVDTKDPIEHEEEDMFLCDVCDGDHELLFLDSYLRESFRAFGRPGHHGGDLSEHNQTSTI